jgi:hypothetical protein
VREARPAPVWGFWRTYRCGKLRGLGFPLLPFGVVLVTSFSLSDFVGAPFSFGDLVSWSGGVGTVRLPGPDVVSVQCGTQWYYFGATDLADGKLVSDLTLVD